MNKSVNVEIKVGNEDGTQSTILSCLVETNKKAATKWIKHFLCRWLLTSSENSLPAIDQQVLDLLLDLLRNEPKSPIWTKLYYATQIHMVNNLEFEIAKDLDGNDNIFIYATKNRATCDGMKPYKITNIVKLAQPYL